MTTLSYLFLFFLYTSIHESKIKKIKVIMSVRSVEEIIRLSDSHSNPNRIAYRHLIKQLDSQIRERAVRHGSLSFRTPSIIFGKPAFEKATVEKKIIKHYSRIGFVCGRTQDDDIIIKW